MNDRITTCQKNITRLTTGTITGISSNEELENLGFGIFIENTITNYLGYNPKFSHEQDKKGESEMADLVRHLGEMDKAVINKSYLSILLDVMFVNNCDYSRMNRIIDDSHDLLKRSLAQVDRLLDSRDRIEREVH